MDKPKRRAHRRIGSQMTLLALMMFGTTLVMTGAILISGLALLENHLTREELRYYRATQDKLPRPTQIQMAVMVVTATPSPTSTVLKVLTPSPTVDTVPFFHDCSLPGYYQYRCRGVTNFDSPVEIKHDTVYTGISAQETLISGDNKLNTMFTVYPGATLRLENISIVNSAWFGITVKEGATLELSNCSFFGHGNANLNHPPKGYYQSSAIWNAGTVRINNCAFEHNYSSRGGAALVNLVTGTVTIHRGHFSDNLAYGTPIYAGGAAVVNYGTMSLNDSYFYNNESTSNSGAALANLNGKVTLTNVVFQGNRASYGGAIFNGAVMVINGGRIRYNTAAQGGGIYNQGILEINKSYIDLNSDNCYNAGKLI